MSSCAYAFPAGIAYGGVDQSTRLCLPIIRIAVNLAFCPFSGQERLPIYFPHPLTPPIDLPMKWRVNCLTLTLLAVAGWLTVQEQSHFRMSFFVGVIAHDCIFSGWLLSIIICRVCILKTMTPSTSLDTVTQKLDHAKALPILRSSLQTY